MVKTSFKWILQLLHEVLLKGLLGSRLGVLTTSHVHYVTRSCRIYVTKSSHSPNGPKHPIMKYLPEHEITSSDMEPLHTLHLRVLWTLTWRSKVYSLYFIVLKTWSTLLHGILHGIYLQWWPGYSYAGPQVW